MDILINTPDNGINWGTKVPILNAQKNEQVGHIEVQVDEKGEWAFWVYGTEGTIHPEPLPTYLNAKLIAEYHFQTRA